VKLPCACITVLLAASVSPSESVDFSWQEMFLFPCSKETSKDVSGYCASRSYKAIATECSRPWQFLGTWRDSFCSAPGIRRGLQMVFLILWGSVNPVQSASKILVPLEVYSAWKAVVPVVWI